MNGKIFNKVNYVIHKIRLIKNGDEKHLNDKKQSKAYLWLANTKRKVLLLMSDENLWDKINIFALFSIKTSKTHKYLGNYPEYNYEYYLWTRGGDIFLKAVFWGLCIGLVMIKWTVKFWHLRGTTWHCGDRIPTTHHYVIACIN